MARVVAILVIILFAGVLAAHPFDDRCDMVAQISLKKDAQANTERMQLQVQYRYESLYASYNEAFLYLDADRDGRVTRPEMQARFETLAADLVAAIYLAVRGEKADLAPDFDNFAFLNLDNPDASVDEPGGMATADLRIGYFFYFDVQFAASLGPGEHPVEFYMASERVAILDPGQQLQAWDDRGSERRAIATVRHDRTPDKFHRLTFLWDIQPDSSSIATPKQPGEARSPEEPRDAGGREQLIETDKQRRNVDQAESTIAEAMAQLRDGRADPWVWAAVLLTMFAVGAYHALMPGHGKTLVAGYLVGTRGRRSDALFLGLVVTAAHTSGVYLLLGGAWAARTMWPGLLENPEKQLAEWIALAVGATIFLMGAGLVMKRAGGGGRHEHDIFGRHIHPEHDHTHPEDSDILQEVHDHDHDHGRHHDHDHGHDHGHHHHHHELDPAKLSRWEILRLGVLGGIIPCPSAFVIGLLAFQWQMEFSGLIAVLAFSVGLATVLATIGLMLVQSKEYLARRNIEGRGPIARYLEAKLPVFGALMITLIGTLIVVFALIRLELIDPSKFTV